VDVQSSTDALAGVVSLYTYLLLKPGAIDLLRDHINVGVHNLSETTPLSEEEALAAVKRFATETFHKLKADPDKRRTFLNDVEVELPELRAVEDISAEEYMSAKLEKMLEKLRQQNQEMRLGKIEVRSIEDATAPVLNEAYVALNDDIILALETTVRILKKTIVNRGT
jgi:hypothetical protein